MIDANTDLYALIGDPVEKSLSPAIHNYCFKATKENSAYVAHTITVDNLEIALKGFATIGYKGLNVTIPHKVNVMSYLDEIDAYADKIGAVNTIKIESGKLKGYNTDGLGLLFSLEQHQFDVKDKKVLVLGAGGAARGIAMTLGLAGAKSIFIKNRTMKKAVELKDDLISALPDTIVEIIGNGRLVEDYDLIINTTSLGMYPYIHTRQLDIQFIKGKTILYDIVYKPHMTKFLKEGLENGHQVIYGIEMLIYQALVSEEIWFDKKMDKVQMGEALSTFLEELI